MSKPFNLDGYGSLCARWQRIVEEKRGETAFIRDGVPVTYGEVDREIASFRMKLHTFKIKSGDRMAIVLDPLLSLYKILIALATRGIRAVVLPENTDALTLGNVARDMKLSGAVCARERVGKMNALRESNPGFVIIDSEVVGDGELEATPNESARAIIISDSERKLSGRCFTGESGSLSADDFLYLE